LKIKGLLIGSAVLALMVVAYFAILAFSIKGKTDSIQRDLQSLRTLALGQQGFPLSQVPALRRDLVRLEKELVDLRRSLSLFLFLDPLLKRTSLIEPTPAQADLVLQAATDLARAAQLVLKGGEELLKLAPEGDYRLLTDKSSGQRLVDALNSAAEKFQEASSYFPSLEAKLEELESLEGGPRLTGYVEEIQGASQALKELVEVGIGASTAVRELLGMESPKNYLILAQNSYELRATGGFISGAWLITLDRGKIVRLVFHDSPDVDDLSKEYPPPPMPMYKYMLAGIWLFRDANWSPDFPTSARVAAGFYEMGQRLKVDGVIGIDDHLARELVVALGPILLEAFQETVSSSNVTSILEQGLADIGRAEAPKIAPRKFLLKVLFDKMLQKVQSGISGDDLGRIAKVMMWALKEKHLLIYLPGTEAEELLSQRNWDGALRNGEADYLQVVDSNIGYNKINHNIDQSIHYEMSWDEEGTGRAKLEISYTNTSSVKVAQCQQGTTPGGYDQWKQGCYWDYLRVYTPGGTHVEKTTYLPLPRGSLVSTLAKLDDPNYPSIHPGENGTNVIGVFFVVPPKEQLTLSFSYQLPSGVLSRTAQGAYYSLLVQKQAGTVGHPITVKIAAPPGMVVAEASPAPATIDAAAVEFRTNLRKDILFTVRFTAKASS